MAGYMAAAPRSTLLLYRGASQSPNEPARPARKVSPRALHLRRGSSTMPTAAR